MLLATLVPKLIGFRACIPRSLSATLSSSSSSSDSTTSLNTMSHRSLRPITLDEALQTTDKSTHMHAAHCLLYCKSVSNDVEGIFGLCQVRFDGQLGFPGGLVDKEELKDVGDLIKGLTRELREETNFIIQPDQADSSGTNGFVHISTYIDDCVDPNNKTDCLKWDSKIKIYHFFIKQISEQEFKQCETSHFQSMHFPLEALGLFRIPLIDPTACLDKTVFRYYKNKGGFLVNFFKHNFAGIAKNQLYDTLVHLNCLTPDYLAKLEKYIYSISKDEQPTD